MRCALIHRPAGHWPKFEATDTCTLDFEARHRRRARLTSDRGEDLILDLPKAIAMAEGDGLFLEGGGWLMIHAAAEPVVEVRHENPDQVARLAWHLGNRHLPIEVRSQVLRIRPDYVIEAMLRGFGAFLVNMKAPFQPEGGAYDDHNNHGIGAHPHE